MALVEPLLDPGDLGRYHLAQATKADLLRRLGRREEARASYEAALALAQQAPEQRFLRRRLAEIGAWRKNFGSLSIPGPAIRPVCKEAQ